MKMVKPRLNDSIALIVQAGKRDDSGHIDTGMLIDIFKEYHSHINIITENSFSLKFFIDNITVIKLQRPFHKSFIFLRMLGELSLQLKQSLCLFGRKEKIKIVYFTSAASFIPLLFTKITRQKSSIIVGSSLHNSYRASLSKSFYNRISYYMAKYLEKIFYGLIDEILVPNNSVIEFNGIRKNKKVKVWEYRTLTPNFVRMSDFMDRPSVVGYIGTINNLKGVPNLIKAIPTIIKKINVKFIIIGEGPLLESLRSSIQRESFSNNVTFLGKIRREQIPDVLNELKLLVIPSFSEGLPKVLIEAMACGTPVLATKVGGISAIIEDGKNGFTVENNSPEVLAERIVEVLSNVDLYVISRNAEMYVKQHFTFNNAKTKYSELFE